MSAPQEETHRPIGSYLVGYALALAMTAAAFAAVEWRWLGASATLAVVLVLALAQIVVQLRCFLHVRFAPSARDDLLLVLFSTLIIALMAGGTLIVLIGLRARMM